MLHASHTNGVPSSVSGRAPSEPAVVPRRKVRVLFINDTARNGGPGRSLFYILKFLDPDVVHRSVVLPRAGIISELLSPVADDLFFEPNLVENPIEPFRRAMVREDFDAPLPLRAARLVANVGKATAALARLSSWLRRGAFDLVYCNGTNADFAGGAIARLTGVPALWHVRYTSLPPAVRGIHDRLAASPHVARIICVSEAAAGLFPHCRDKVKVIHNALDIDEFSPEKNTKRLRTELKLPNDAVIFGSQGRVLPRKGYVEMVHAASKVLKELSEEDRKRCHFVVLGDTPEDIRPDHLAECRELVRNMNLTPWISFLGFQPDVKPYVADFDVAVVPSVYPDPLPRSVIESMAMGKPVIAFDMGGVKEMVRDGETGTLVRGSPPDVDGLAQQMLRYFRDKDLRQAAGTAARARIEREFSAVAQARRIQNEIVRAAGLGT